MSQDSTPVKTCKHCEQELPISHFSKAARNRDGLKSRCKKCDKRINHAYYKVNREEKIAQSKKWQRENPQKYFDYQLKYRLNQEEID